MIFIVFIYVFIKTVINPQNYAVMGAGQNRNGEISKITLAVGHKFAKQPRNQNILLFVIIYQNNNGVNSQKIETGKKTKKTNWS